MRSAEIRERTDEELATLAEQLNEDLYRLRVQKATNQLEDTSALRQVRRDLARVLTIARARHKGIETSDESR